MNIKKAQELHDLFLDPNFTAMDFYDEVLKQAEIEDIKPNHKLEPMQSRLTKDVRQ